MKVALIGGAVLAGGALVVWLWPRPPSAGRSGEDLARAWASGDIDVILAFAPPTEQERLSKAALQAIYDRAVREYLGGIRLVSVTKGEVDDDDATTWTSFNADLVAGDGTKFGTAFTVHANGERRWAGAIFDLRLMMTTYTMSKEGIAFQDASRKAGEVLRPILWDAGVRQWVVPGDGEIKEVRPPEG